MTTTHTFQGLNTDNRPSSRVLNPPGGSSNNIFGCDNQPRQNPAQRRPENNQMNCERSAQEPFASGPQQKSRAARNAFNPITGEPYEQPKVQPEKQPPANITTGGTSEKAIPEPETVDSAYCDSSIVIDVLLEEEAVKPMKPESEKPVAPPVKQERGDQVPATKINGMREHPSTRVLQPPGGHSSKLW